MKKYITPSCELDIFTVVDIVMESKDTGFVGKEDIGGNTGGGSTDGDTDIASIIRGALGM